jgi:hypothetical protein
MTDFKQGGPHVGQIPPEGSGAIDGYTMIRAFGFRPETLHVDIEKAFTLLLRCSSYFPCLHAGRLNGSTKTQILAAAAAALDIAGLTTATPASGDLFIFADVSASDAIRKATLAAINAILDHGTLAGLGDDDHTQYALLLGRSGGQELIGGTASGNNLRLQSTSNATRGNVISEDVFKTESGRIIASATVAGSATLANTYQFLTVTASATISVPSPATFIGHKWEIVNTHSAAITLGNNGFNINGAAANFSIPAGARCHVDWDPTGNGWLATISSTEDGFFETLNVSGKLTVGGLIDPTGLVCTEQASSPHSTGAGEGTFYVRNSVPSKPAFEGDTGADELIALASDIANQVTAASVFAAANRVLVADGNDRSVDDSDFTMSQNSSNAISTADGNPLTFGALGVTMGTLASGAHTITVASTIVAQRIQRSSSTGQETYVAEATTAVTATVNIDIPVPTDSAGILRVSFNAVEQGNPGKYWSSIILQNFQNSGGAAAIGGAADTVLHSDTVSVVGDGATVVLSASGANARIAVTAGASLALHWGVTAVWENVRATA